MKRTVQAILTGLTISAALISQVAIASAATTSPKTQQNAHPGVSKHLVSASPSPSPTSTTKKSTTKKTKPTIKKSAKKPVTSATPATPASLSKKPVQKKS